jgi:thiol-disulfide isomerase/thioredoxin/cytochrome c-type biogenesis protein CcmH/NrfG
MSSRASRKGVRAPCGEVLVLLLLGLVMTAPLGAQDQLPAPQPAPAEKAQDSNGAPPPSQAEGETAALDRAFSASPGDPQALIKNLEAFLEKYPQSPRREQVLRMIYSQALQGNDPLKAGATAEKLLELKPNDLDLLGALTDLYGRKSDRASQEKALGYATRLIQRAENLKEDSRPSKISAEQWREARDVFRASAYSRRGKIYSQLDDDKKAAADFESSLAVYPTAQAAEHLGDVAMKLGDTDRAIDAYATAFILPDKRLDAAQREEIRRKLGGAYVLKNPSEQGLGDLILARYDELVKSHPEHFAAESEGNGEVRDPFEFVLERLDGTPLRLADFRGKVVVMDFWATWCPPCRLEGKLLEQVLEAFRTEKSVEFLAVNADEDPSVVSDFIKEAGWKVPVAFSRGLDSALGIRALPTVLILDAKGRVVFRQVGIDPGSFVPTVEAKVHQALATLSD